MARTGPVTKDTTTVALGYAQIRVGNSATHIGQIRQILGTAKSVGALANTKWTGDTEFFRLESGFPLLEDAVFPIREKSMLECAFKEITPANLALSRGLDPADYSDAHTGEIPLGNLSTPTYIRMEAHYTYPDGTNKMYIIFPRAQVVGAAELDFAESEPAAVPITIEAKRADAEVSGGHVIWNGKPLGIITWDDSTNTTTSSTTSTTTA